MDVDHWMLTQMKQLLEQIKQLQKVKQFQRQTHDLSLSLNPSLSSQFNYSVLNLNNYLYLQYAWLSGNDNKQDKDNKKDKGHNKKQENENKQENKEKDECIHLIRCKQLYRQMAKLRWLSKRSKRCYKHTKNIKKTLEARQRPRIKGRFCPKCKWMTVKDWSNKQTPIKIESIESIEI